MDMLLKGVYAILAGSMAYLAFRMVRTIIAAVRTGTARPNARLDAVTRDRHPVAYWSFVLSWSLLLIPATAGVTALLVGAVLGFVPISR